MAHIFEKLGEFISDRVADVADHCSGKRRFIVRIATTDTLELKRNHASHGGFTASFDTLDAGGAGVICWEHSGEHGGAAELWIKEERLFISQYTKASYSTLFGGDKFILGFYGKDDGRDLVDFYKTMPDGFCGDKEAGKEVEVTGGRYAAVVKTISAGYTTEIDLLIGSQSHLAELQEIRALDALQQVALAEQSWDHCQASDPHLLASALMFCEFTAINYGLGEFDSYSESAFALDLLIHAFVNSGAIGDLTDSLRQQLNAWQSSGRKLDLPEDGTVVTYSVYHALIASDSDWSKHVENAFVLLRSLSLSCATKTRPTAKAMKQAGQWPPVLREEAELFKSSGDEVDYSNIGALAAHLLGGISKSFSSAFSKGQDKDQFLKDLVRRCIDSSAKFNRARLRLLEALAERQSSDNARKMLRYYAKICPITRRSFSVPSLGDALPAADFTSFCSELFSSLDDSVSPAKVLASLGQGSDEYKALTTNSKSGEFFFLSKDACFLIKTLSEAEGMVLYKMLPAYQHHIRSYPQSMICRFSGLFCVNIPDQGTRYFTVMTSVFDPMYKIHVNYDLKGSLHNRKKKEGESTGKDEDWVTDGQRLRLPDEVRREVLATHEVDAYFLMSFGVMDYSVLVGIHNLAEGCHYEGGSGLSAEGRSGLLALGGREVYFAGLIDFLISFGLKKKAENILRTCQGVGDTVSCVDPNSYAMRQVRFMRERVVESWKEGAEDIGTVGTLIVDVISAKNLINTDGFLDKSDPYFQVNLGLQCARTPTIQDNLNPEWNCTLRLPVNTFHVEKDIELSVWDEDDKKTQGSDDSLGRLSVPMKRLIQETKIDVKEHLQGVKKGEILVKLRFEGHEANGHNYSFEPNAMPPARAAGGYRSCDSEHAVAPERLSLATDFAAGEVVTIAGLKTNPEFNDQRAEVLRFDETEGRWTVKMQDGMELAAKSANLISSGKVVTIVGLTAHPEFNDQRAEVLRFDDAELRWIVKVPGGTELSVKSANLVSSGN